MIGLTHYLHSSFEKSLMERVNQYFKDRTEGFDDYYHVLEMNVNISCIQQQVMILILSLREVKLL